MVVAIIGELEIGRILDSGEVLCNSKFLPPGTKGLVLKKSTKEEWIDYCIREAQSDPKKLNPHLFTNFYEVSWD